MIDAISPNIDLQQSLEADSLDGGGCSIQMVEQPISKTVVCNRLLYENCELIAMHQKGYSSMQSNIVGLRRLPTF